MKTSGTGLRSIVDLYVFLKSAGDKLDRDYVDGELEKLGISMSKSVFAVLRSLFLKEMNCQMMTDRFREVGYLFSRRKDRSDKEKKDI